jgi:hypothetical protein
MHYLLTAIIAVHRVIKNLEAQMVVQHVLVNLGLGSGRLRLLLCLYVCVCVWCMYIYTIF